MNKKTNKPQNKPTLHVKSEKLKNEVVAYKLQNPEESVRNIAKHFWISKTRVADIIKDNTKKADYNTIVQNAKEIVETWQKLIKDKIASMDLEDIETQSDLNLLTSSLKNSQALINMIENNQSNNPKWNIPVNIQVNIDNNWQMDVQEVKTDNGDE